MVYKATVPTTEEAVVKSRDFHGLLGQRREQVQTKVYKDRIRIKEFFSDFDKLRCGFITQSQFKSGLSMAGLKLSAEEMQVLAESYCNPEDPQLRVGYTVFCKHVDSVFGKTELEKTPREPVHLKPDGLVNPYRFLEVPTRNLGDEAEMRLQDVTEKLQYDCRTKRILVKHFFDDSSKNQNSPLLVNHVSIQQFRQTLKNHIAPDLSLEEVNLLIAKFCGEAEFDDMINYVAFAQSIDPPPEKFDCYTLKTTS